MELNTDISLRSSSLTLDRNAILNIEKFLNYLLNGKLAILEFNYLVNYQKQRVCNKKPNMRWHVVKTNIPETRMGIGMRKDLDKSIKKKINKMYENCIDYLLNNCSFI